jgi:hypothetical protein
VADEAARAKRALDVLNRHYDSYSAALELAEETGHPVPVDTRAWSQILVSVLYGVPGLARLKGADFTDGSDVKAASTWSAIDTPRFNGVLKAGTHAAAAGTMASLDAMPHLFFVLWDNSPTSGNPRCRVWAVRPQHDGEFRAMCERWYAKRRAGEIVSNNFQLHPPRGLGINTFRNLCGNLDYPLLFQAERPGKGSFTVVVHEPDVLDTGECHPASPDEARQVRV